MSANCLDLNDPNNVWQYCPSYAAAVLFAVMFGLATSSHLFLAIKYRKRFCWVIIMAGLWETVGFSLRVPSTQDETNLALYISQQLFILLAPIWINAFVYMVLGRMILFFLPEQKVAGVKAKRLTLCFVLLDITAFLIQATGGTMLSSTNRSTVQIGLNVYMAGIGSQEAFLLLFLFLTITFHRKVRQVENVRSTDWKWLLFAVYAAVVLITVRIIFRLIEFSQGVNATVPTHEAYFYCLDALPMFIAICVFSVGHPGRVLVGSESEFPSKSREQKDEEKRQKEEVKKQDQERKKQLRVEGRQRKVGAISDSGESSREWAQLETPRSEQV